MLNLRPAILTLSLICSLAVPSRALIVVGRGNTPVHDQDWRTGSIDVANLSCRVGWWEGPPFGGGRWTFLYRGNTEQFNDALKVFAKVRAPALELVLRDGPHESQFLRDPNDPKSDTRVDWEFLIWNARSFYHLNSNPTSTFLADSPEFRQPLPAPQITVFIGGGGQIDWAKVQVPGNITVTDNRTVASGAPPGSGAVISGGVFDMPTSKILPDATITVGKLNAQNGFDTVAGAESGEDGRFRIEKIPPGSYRITVSAKGHATLVLGYEDLRSGGYLRFDDIELVPQAAISGKVVDASGKPLSGVSVRADSIIALNGRGYRLSGSTQAATDAEGRFTIADLPAGYADLRCFAKGYYGPPSKLREVPSKDQIVMRMITTGTVRGKVLDANGRVPAGQVLVEIHPEGGDRVGTWGGSMYAKPDGTFQFDNVPPGNYFLSAKPNPGRSDVQYEQKPVTVKGGQTEEVQLTLP